MSAAAGKPHSPGLQGGAVHGFPGPAPWVPHEGDTDNTGWLMGLRGDGVWSAEPGTLLYQHPPNDAKGNRQRPPGAWFSESWAWASKGTATVTVTISLTKGGNQEGSKPKREVQSPGVGGRGMSPSPGAASQGRSLSPRGGPGGRTVPAAWRPGETEATPAPSRGVSRAS